MLSAAGLAMFYFVVFGVVLLHLQCGERTEGEQGHKKSEKYQWFFLFHDAVGLDSE
ncbi:MAG: hypothetical protein ACI8SE_001659 [Bacteroidia bacterium]